MVDRPARWIAENVIEARYPFWTRANVSEVLPEPTSPLGFDVAWEGAAIAGWRDLFIQRLGMEDHELNPRRCEALGVFGGYGYLGAAMFRVWAGRTPGMTPTTIDELYFDEHPDVPPYVAEPWHTNPHTSEVMAGYLGWATGDMNQDELEADRLESLAVRAARPDHAALSDEALLSAVMAIGPLCRRMFHQHINQSIAASVGPGIINAICAAVGHPEWAMRLLTGFGGVDSAAPAYAMWELSRTVRGSASLTAAFDAGVRGLLDRLRSADDGDAAGFVHGFGRFIAEHGSRGYNEWDLAATVWENRPETALAAVDRMRLAPDSDAPRNETAAREADRRALVGQIEAALAGNDEALATFGVGMRAAATFIPGRERSKTSIIRVIHEGRMAALELGRRFAGRGWIEKPSDVFLLFADELAEAVANNRPDLSELATRRAYLAWLATLEPPFIINGTAPPNTSWSQRGARPVSTLGVGESITGIVGCPGIAEGRARVILDPNDAEGLEPGDILVAPATDPSWTPLFVPAAAVVVDVGALLSHSIIVSRELGIPCVPSASDATRRIPDGARVRVDGDTGVVTLLALPA